MIRDILEKLRITKQDWIMMIKAIVFMTVSIYAWVFIIPLVYVYAKPTFFIVQYLPDVNMGLIIIWLLRYAMKSEKKKDEKK